MPSLTISLIVVSVVVSTLLGIIANIVATMLQPHLDQRLRLVIGLFVGLLGALILLTVILSWPNNQRSSETASPIYQVHVESKTNGRSIERAAITIEVGTQAPLHDLTDTSGLARIALTDDLAGKPRRLSIDAPDYRRFVQQIDLNPQTVPLIIQLEPQ
jgi:predicted PurR-regulated permease PerM